MVSEALEKVDAKVLSAFITPVRLALEVGACEAVANALPKLVICVAMDWLSPGLPSNPFSWPNRSAMVSYCEAAPPAESCSWVRKSLVMRWTLAISTPISWPPAESDSMFTIRRA
jgi:hypothetical protein